MIVDTDRFTIQATGNCVTVGEAVHLECVYKVTSCIAHGCMAWRAVSVVAVGADSMTSKGYCGMVGMNIGVIVEVDRVIEGCANTSTF